LRATIGTDYSATQRTGHYDQIVVNHGTLPLDDLYFALKPLSANKGALDQDAFIKGTAQPDHGPGFALYRIGDAVAARNTHAAIYEALRLVKEI
jgi:N-methyl-L-proline demethylase